jgi:DNA-binding IclR family transcriptional regulator
VPGSIQSIERAAAVLRLLGSTDRPLGIIEIAAALDLPRPTAHGIVRTLREVGFVDQDQGTSRYALGPALRELGSGGWDRHDLRAQAMNWADSLAGSTGLAVHLGVAAERAVRLVHHVFRPDGSAQRIRTGEQQPLHATALGKCLLAQLDDEEARRAAGREPYPALTPRTVTSWEKLGGQLERVRREGVAYSREEYEVGLHSIAVPLAWVDGDGPVAVNVSLPSSRGGRDATAELARELQAAADRISGAA